MEERRLEEVLSNLRSEVKKRRLLMYPYYRDYDRVSGRGGRGGDGRSIHNVNSPENAPVHPASCMCITCTHIFTYSKSHLLPPPLPHRARATPYRTPWSHKFKPLFECLLHFLSIQLSPEDLKLFERKFESPVRTVSVGV